MDMRGLSTFIADIRRATNNREEEIRRVDVELAKIRSKFKKSNELSSYDRKKYVCKLMFITMLGYEVDFGHMQGVNLLSGTTPSEKLIGYLSVTVFLHENHELLTLCTHTICLDLISGKEFNMCLAMTAISNVGGKDFAEAMAQHVQKVVTSNTFSPLVKKKSLLTLLRLYRKYREVVQIDTVLGACLKALTSENLGVCHAAMSLVLGLMSEEDLSIFSDVPKCCILVLERIILDKETHPDYVYYGVPAPWLQLKTLRLLQYFPLPANSTMAAKITSIVGKILKATERIIRDAQQQQQHVKGTQNRLNAMNAVLIEVISLVIHWDCNAEMLQQCAELLSSFIQDSKDVNMRYIGLTLMSRLSFCTSTSFQFTDSVRNHQVQIISSLHDADISIRQRSLDLLYCMCNRDVADEIVGELLIYLPHADPFFREDLVLMIAILAEKFCSEFSWYVEVILSLIASAGDHVSSDIWQRVCHIVVNTASIQKHAVETVFKAVTLGSAHEVMVKVAAFLLGEFGYQIALNPESTPMAQFQALHSKFSVVSDSTKCMLLDCYVKFFNLYDDVGVRDRIRRVFLQCKSSFNAELQQRSTEYHALVTAVSDEVLQAALEPLPPFDMSINPILNKFKEKQKGTDRNLWSEKGAERDELQAAEAAARREAGTNEAMEGTVTEATTTNYGVVSAEQPRHVDPTADQMTVNPDRQQSDLIDLAPTESKPQGARSPPQPTCAAGGGIDELFGPAPTSSPTPPNRTSPPPSTTATGNNNVTGAVPLMMDTKGGPQQQVLKKPTPPPSPPTTTVTGGSSNPLDDIFSVRAPGAGAASRGSSSGTTMGQPSQVSKNEENFRQLKVLANGILYEDDYVQISAVQETRGADARLTLTVKNLSSQGPISQLSCQSSRVPAQIILQCKPCEPSIAPGGTTEVAFAARCLSPFDDHPFMSLSYCPPPSASGASSLRTISVPLPIVVTKFVDPYKLDDVKKFWGLWDNTMSGNDRYVDPPISIRFQNEMELTDVEGLLFRRLRLNVLRESATRVLGIGAHACHPQSVPVFSPVLVVADLDPSEHPGEILLAVKNPNVVLQEAVHNRVREQVQNQR